MIREAMQLILQNAQDLQVTAEAKDGQEAIELTRLHRPDLVLMDVKMPKVNGFEATQIIKEELLTTKVLIVSAYKSAAPSTKATVAGADGYLPKLCLLQELLEAISAVIRGEAVYL